VVGVLVKELVVVGVVVPGDELPERAKYAAPPATTTMMTTITARAVVAMPRLKSK
jgi:hypothetical protein